MKRCVKKQAIAAAIIGVALALSLKASANAQYNPVWFDGYEATPGLNINADLGSPRQGGSPIPLAYDVNVGSSATMGQVDDYHQQIIGPDLSGNHLLQLAGDVGITAGMSTSGGQNFHAYASPDHNFKGFAGSQVIGKKISVLMDATTNRASMDPGQPGVNFDGFFTQAAITIGSSEKLADSNGKASGFSVIFIEQTFDENLPYENFIQIRDAGDPPGAPQGNLIPNPAGDGAGFVEFLVNDPTDGNPWDGVGQTDIEVLVNGTSVFNYSKGGGGYSDNYITLDGSNQKNFSLSSGPLATHVFDNLTVYSAPVPEPSSLLLLGAGLVAIAVGQLRRTEGRWFEKVG